MSDMEMKVSIPLDDDGYLRKECPLCLKQFKVLLTEEEKNDFVNNAIKLYMVQDEKIESEENMDLEHTCPYCGQKAPSDGWWTQEQAEFFRTIAENMAADLVNETLVKALKGMSNDLFKVDANEMEKKKVWMHPEINDMTVFNLDCCERKIKIEDGWNGTVYCFFCGFPHEK